MLVNKLDVHVTFEIRNPSIYSSIFLGYVSTAGIPSGDAISLHSEAATVWTGHFENNKKYNSFLSSPRPANFPAGLLGSGDAHQQVYL